MAALGVVAYARDRSENPGVATEIALLLAYLIGVLCASDRLLAAALAVMVTGLLALRAPLHEFSNHWLQPGEVRSGLVLAALVLLVFPLVPNQPLMQGLLNPQVVLRLVIVLLVIQSLAHVARRLMQARQAVVLSALASGFVSSTATIASLGMDVRTGKAPPARRRPGPCCRAWPPRCICWWWRPRCSRIGYRTWRCQRWQARRWRPFGACGCCGGAADQSTSRSAAAGRCAHVQTARCGVD